jgi:hypothetical protein
MDPLIDKAQQDFTQRRYLVNKRIVDAMNEISEKYSGNFDGIADEIDIETGDIAVDNGHIENMRHEQDIGRAPASHQRIVKELASVPISSSKTGSERGDADEETDVADEGERSKQRKASVAHSDKENERPILFDRLRDASSSTPSPNSEITSMMADQLNVDRNVFQNFMTAITSQIQAAVATQLNDFAAQLTGQIPPQSLRKLDPAFSLQTPPLDPALLGSAKRQKTQHPPQPRMTTELLGSDPEVPEEYPDIEAMPPIRRAATPGAPPLWHPDNDMYNAPKLRITNQVKDRRKPKSQLYRRPASMRAAADQAAEQSVGSHDTQDDEYMTAEDDEEMVDAEDAAEDGEEEIEEEPVKLTADGRRTWKRCKFTPAEEKLLLQLWSKSNMTWSEIAEHFEGRTSRQVSYKVAKMLGDKINDKNMDLAQLMAVADARKDKAGSNNSPGVSSRAVSTVGMVGVASPAVMIPSTARTPVVPPAAKAPEARSTPRQIVNKRPRSGSSASIKVESAPSSAKKPSHTKLPQSHQLSRVQTASRTTKSASSPCPPLQPDRVIAGTDDEEDEDSEEDEDDVKSEPEAEDLPNEETSDEDELSLISATGSLKRKRPGYGPHLRSGFRQSPYVSPGGRLSRMLLDQMEEGPSESDEEYVDEE